jgi:hypothetical protein
MCPAVKTPILTETCLKVIKGTENILIPTNGKEFVEMIK